MVSTVDHWDTDESLDLPMGAANNNEIVQLSEFQGDRTPRKGGHFGRKYNFLQTSHKLCHVQVLNAVRWL